MIKCQNCGAPQGAGSEGAFVCKFCNIQNAAPPDEIQIAVPVQVVHQTVQVVGAPGASVRELRCPHCNKRLVTANVADVALNGCADCGGIWIDNVSARQLFVSPQRVFMELATRAGTNARKKHPMREIRPLCPTCQDPLEQRQFHRISLDVCNEHGTWFDAFELAHVVERLQKPASAAEEKKPAKVSCVKCTMPMESAEANISDQGAMCDACWRMRQQQLLDESVDRRRSPAFFGAMLLDGFAAVGEGVTAVGDAAIRNAKDAKLSR